MTTPNSSLPRPVNLSSSSPPQTSNHTTQNPSPTFKPPLTSSPRSAWSDLFRRNNSNGSTLLKIYSPVILNGKAQVPDDIIDEGVEIWADYLVGYFVDKKMPFGYVQDVLKKTWKLQGTVEITADKEMFYFKFADNVERQKVLEFGPIYIGGKLFVIRQWTKQVEMHKSKVSTLPIWIKVYEIPKELWSPNGISFIASLLGLPLCMDELTLKRTRLEFAKICVEIPVGFEYPETLSLDLKYRAAEVKLEYPWSPASCSSCACFGHTLIKCPKKKSTVWTAKTGQPQATFNVHVPLNSIVLTGDTSCLRDEEGVPINHLEGNPSTEPNSPTTAHQSPQLAIIVVTTPEKSPASSTKSLDLQLQTPAVVLCSLTDATNQKFGLEEEDHVVTSIELVDKAPKEDIMNYISEMNEFQALEENAESEESSEDEIEVFTDHIEKEHVTIQPEFFNDQLSRDPILVHSEQVLAKSNKKVVPLAMEIRFRKLNQVVQQKEDQNDLWTTVETKKTKKKKLLLELSPGKIEPTLNMIKKISSKSNKRIKHLVGYIKEVWDDSFGLSYACSDCGRFFREFGKAQTHLRNEHPELLKLFKGETNAPVFFAL